MITALHQAAEDACLAPSILNTQPWRWSLHDDVLDLYADTSRRLSHLDAHGRLMTLSCGVALHHARVSLAAAGYDATVDRLPDRGQSGPLARIRDCRTRPATYDGILEHQSIRLRHTDRRPFATGIRVPDAIVAQLRIAAEAEHARLCLLDRADIVYLRYAAQGAHTVGTHAPPRRRRPAGMDPARRGSRRRGTARHRRAVVGRTAGAVARFRSWRSGCTRPRRWDRRLRRVRGGRDGW